MNPCANFLESKDAMPQPIYQLHCSDACREKPIVRSVRICPECNRKWDTQADAEHSRYCNGAWTLCRTCAVKQQRCVICGSSIEASSSDAGIEPDLTASHGTIRHGGLHD